MKRLAIIAGTLSMFFTLNLAHAECDKDEVKRLFTAVTKQEHTYGVNESVVEKNREALERAVECMPLEYAEGIRFGYGEYRKFLEENIEYLRKDYKLFFSGAYESFEEFLGKHHNYSTEAIDLSKRYDTNLPFLTPLIFSMIGEHKKVPIFIFPMSNAFYYKNNENAFKWDLDNYPVSILYSYIIDHEEVHAKDIYNGLGLDGLLINQENIGYYSPEILVNLYEVRAWHSQVERIVENKKPDVNPHHFSYILANYWITLDFLQSEKLNEAERSLVEQQIDSLRYIPVYNNGRLQLLKRTGVGNGP